MTPEQKRQHIEEVARRVAERLAEHWPGDDAGVVELEDFAERMGREVQRELSERALRDLAEQKDGNQLACPCCGGRALYRRHQPLTLATAAGRIRVRRAYYLCPCGWSTVPADERLGLGAANTTPTAQARYAVLTSLESYVQSQDLARQLGLPLELDIKSTERVTQALGHRLQGVRLRPYGRATRTVVVSFDGVTVPTFEGRREARVGVIYEPEWGAPRTPAAEAGLRKEYVATMGSRESLVREVCERALERAGDGVVQVVCDGQALDWVDLDRYLPNRVETLDFYHVMERVAEIAKLMHGETEGAAAWRAEIKKALLEQGPGTLLAALRKWKPEGEKATEERRIQLAYFERQQERMRYPQFLERGYAIGSGAAEGACKHVVVDRFRRTGMRWKPETAEPVMRIRAAIMTQQGLDLRQFAANKPASNRRARELAAA